MINISLLILQKLLGHLRKEEVCVNSLLARQYNYIE